VLSRIDHIVRSVARKLVPSRYRPWFRPVRRFFKAVIRLFSASRREEHKLGNMIGPVGYWKEMQEYQLGLLKRLGMEPRHKLLDIGCGPLSGGLAFIPYLDTGNYYGVDLREKAIEEATRQVKKAGLEDKKPVLTVSSTFGREELDGTRFDYVWMSQTSYHLDDGLIENCLETVAERLNPGGRFYADFLSDPAMVTPGKKWFEYSWYFHTFEDMERKSRRHGLELTNLGTIEQFGYPVDWALKTNHLFVFHRAEDGSGPPGN
jgi:SAM-dependent methyltransferase